MSIRNFSKLFSKMVCREPLKMPIYIPFRNFSIINNIEAIEINQMNEKNKTTGQKDSILFDKKDESIKTDVFSKSAGQSAFERIFSRNAEFEGISRTTQSNERGNYGASSQQELTDRAKKLESLTKRDFQQCLDLCIQHSEKSVEQIAQMIDKISSKHKKAE